MSTARHLVTFNANQFDHRAQIAADLEVRIAAADVVLLQELVNFDLARFARKHTADGQAWSAHQLDAGTDNGDANTAVLFKTELGPVEDTICLFVGHAHDTRARYLIGVKLGGVWYLALHIFPRRDSKLIAKQLEIVGGWVKEQGGDPIVIGLDRNQAKPAAMEAATGLTWHGGTDDPTGGILTNLPVGLTGEFHKGNSDHLGFAATVFVASDKPVTRVFHAPSPEYVGPSPHFMGNIVGSRKIPISNQPFHRIVLHCTVSPCVPGGRYAIAHMFNTSTRTASCHYITDPAGAVQDVFDNLVAEHAPPNQGSLGIEQCDPLVSQAWDKAHAGRWDDAPHQSMLHHSANIAARLCLAYGIPARKLTPGQVGQGQRGICGHVDVDDAFHESDHWDPGPAFPWDDFLGKVHRKMARLEAA